MCSYIAHPSCWDGYRGRHDELLPDGIWVNARILLDQQHCSRDNTCMKSMVNDVDASLAGGYVHSVPVSYPKRKPPMAERNVSKRMSAVNSISD